MATIGHPDSRLLNIPAAKGIENLVEARLNNALLDKPISDGGWLVFDRLSPELFAVGPNLVGLRLTQPRPRTAESYPDRKTGGGGPLSATLSRM